MKHALRRHDFGLGRDAVLVARRGDAQMFVCNVWSCARLLPRPTVAIHDLRQYDETRHCYNLQVAILFGAAKALAQRLGLDDSVAGLFAEALGMGNTGLLLLWAVGHCDGMDRPGRKTRKTVSACAETLRATNDDEPFSPAEL